MAKLDDGKISVDGKAVEVTLLEGDEEEAYLKKVTERIGNANKQQRGGGRGGTPAQPFPSSFVSLWERETNGSTGELSAELGSTEYYWVFNRVAVSSLVFLLPTTLLAWA